MSAVLGDLGQLHIVTGKITVTTNTWTLTTNDGSATLTDDGDGLQSVNFVEPFLSAPTVIATAITATEATTFNVVEVVTVTTTIASFAYNHDTAATNSVADPDNGEGWYFIAIGLRNN